MTVGAGPPGTLRHPLRPGTMALVEGGLPDLDRLRADRRRRVFEAMAVDGLDALVVGRPANVAYVSGARQLWTAGARPFSPACVAVAATGRVHLLSTWDEGVPAEIGRDGLYGLTWNPANLTGSLARIPGLPDAATVATDSSTPGFPAMLSAVAARAELVDARALLWRLRRTKTADELACILTATAIAESALTAMAGALEPGVTERQLVGVYAECLAGAGVPTPASEAVAWVSTGHRGGRPRSASARAVGPGELVVLDPGALFAGYEGGVGRTAVAATEAAASVLAVAARCTGAVDALVDACRPGSSGRDLQAAWHSSNGDAPGDLCVHGVGLGMEPPVVDRTRGSGAHLASGMVLSVSAWAADGRRGGCYERELVLVEEHGARRLSRFPRGVLAAG